MTVYWEQRVLFFLKQRETLIPVGSDFLLQSVKMQVLLENKKIQTRTLFAGNIIKHPAFDEMRETGEGYRIVGELPVTDYVMNNTLWIGVFPGMTDSMLDYMIATIKEFCNR